MGQESANKRGKRGEVRRSVPRTKHTKPIGFSTTEKEKRKEKKWGGQLKDTRACFVGRRRGPTLFLHNPRYHKLRGEASGRDSGTAREGSKVGQRKNSESKRRGGDGDKDLALLFNAVPIWRGSRRREPETER